MVEEIQRHRSFPTEDIEYFTPQAISDDKYGEMWVDEYPDYNTNFPTREMADRFDYGYGQHRPQYNEPFYNPNAFESQLGLDQFPGGASNAARIHNEYEQTGRHWASSPKDIRSAIDWSNAVGDSPEIDPMYRDLYRDLYNFDLADMDLGLGPSEMWKSKREQIEEARASGIYGDYIANMMEDYGRDNPYLQELGGTFIGPRGEEEYRDYKMINGERIPTGYDIRLPGEVSADYRSNLDPYVALPPSNIGYDKAGPAGIPSNIGFDRAGGTGVPSDIGYDRAGPAGPAPDPEWPNTPPPGWTPPAGPPPPPGVGEYPEPEITFPNTPPPGWTPKPPLGPPYIWGDEPEEDNWRDKIPRWLWPFGAGQGAKGIGTLFGSTRE